MYYQSATTATTMTGMLMMADAITNYYYYYYLTSYYYYYSLLRCNYVMPFLHERGESTLQTMYRHVITNTAPGRAIH